MIEHSFFAVNIVVSYFCLFFYQYLMSPVTLLALTVSLGLNFCAFSRALSNHKKRVHLAFSHVSSLICFVLVAGSAGCLLGTITQFDFAFRYFCIPGHADNYFPLSAITAGGVLVVYCPILLRLRSHSSLSSRILDFLIGRQLHVRRTERVEEVTRVAGFRNFNSWDKERSEIASKLSF